MQTTAASLASSGACRGVLPRPDPAWAAEAVTDGEVEPQSGHQATPSGIISRRRRGRVDIARV
jgi:hypothetical protein